MLRTPCCSPVRIEGWASGFSSSHSAAIWNLGNTRHADAQSQEPCPVHCARRLSEGEEERRIYHEGPVRTGPITHDDVIEKSAELLQAQRLDLVADDGLVAGRATAEVFDASGKAVMCNWGEKRVQFEGTIILDRLPVGDLKARVTIPGRDPFEVRFKVEAGCMTRISHELPHAAP